MILDKNDETKKLIDLLSDLSDSAEDVLPESGIDIGQFFLTVAPKPISAYSDRGELDEDAVVNASEEELAADKPYSVYAIWFDLISEVDLTVDNPVAGTKITCTDNVYGSDQSPVPSVSINSSHCNLMKIPVDGETMRDAVNYMTRGENPDFYPDVVMTEGEKYTAYASLVPDFAYYFDSQVKLMINGKDESSQIAKYFPDALSFYYDIEAVKATEDRYYVFAGDGNNWKKGSSSTADFTFKRTIEDESTFENFSGIRVDGKDVERVDKNYTAGSGSVIIKLQPAYLETLSVGEHALTAIFADDMTAEAKFTVVQESSGGSSGETKPAYKIPVTGVE